MEWWACAPQADMRAGERRTNETTVDRAAAARFLPCRMRWAYSQDTRRLWRGGASALTVGRTGATTFAQRERDSPIRTPGGIAMHHPLRARSARVRAAQVLLLVVALLATSRIVPAAPSAVAVTPVTPVPCPQMTWRYADPSFTALPGAGVLRPVRWRTLPHGDPRQLERRSSADRARLRQHQRSERRSPLRGLRFSAGLVHIRAWPLAGAAQPSHRERLRLGRLQLPLQWLCSGHRPARHDAAP